MFWNKTFMQYFEQTHEHLLTKIQQTCSKNEIKNKCPFQWLFLSSIYIYVCILNLKKSFLNYVNIHRTKARTSIQKSDLSDEMLLYGCTTWTLTKRIKKKLDENYTRMLRVILSKNPTKHQLYSHLHPISKVIEVRRTRRTHKRRSSKDPYISMQHPTKHQLYGHLHPISKAIQVKLTRRTHE